MPFGPPINHKTAENTGLKKNNLDSQGGWTFWRVWRRSYGGCIPVLAAGPTEVIEHFTMFSWAKRAKTVFGASAMVANFAAASGAMTRLVACVDPRLVPLPPWRQHTIFWSEMRHGV